MIVDIKLPHKSVASLRLDQKRITLNEHAITLLGLDADSRVRVALEQDQVGRSRVIIGKSEKAFAYAIKFKSASCAYINSTHLCEILMSKLSGPGTYRICEEEKLNCSDGTVLYEVFFQKLEPQL